MSTKYGETFVADEARHATPGPATRIHYERSNGDGARGVFVM
jgi:hypothetical protein